MTRRATDRPPPTRRLFVAVELPSPVHRAIDEALGRWRTVVDARWVPPDRRHVTVRFVGAVDAGAIGAARRGVSDAAGSVSPTDARLTTLGAFPSARRAGVVWAGVEDPTGRLAALAAALDAALAPLSPPPARPFHPHVTVGRCHPPRRLPDGFATTPLEPVVFRIERAVLFESVPGGGGPPRYEPVATAALAG